MTWVEDFKRRARNAGVALPILGWTRDPEYQAWVKEHCGLMLKAEVLAKATDIASSTKKERWTLAERAFASGLLAVSSINVVLEDAALTLVRGDGTESELLLARELLVQAETLFKRSLLTTPCAGCGRIPEHDARFCARCGAQVRWG